MASLFGRKVVGYKLNNSGGGVIAGDVVVPDTSADNAFTTTNSAAVTTGAWVADETIASAATGRVVLSGHVTLINVTASVTRGHLGTTSTTVKKAVSTGGTTRTVGTFCKFTTGGTTPEADIWPVDLLGSSLTNPMTTKGDIIVADTGGTPTALAVGSTSGHVLTSNGSAAFPSYQAPAASAGLLAVTAFRPGSNSNVATTSSATLADADATNLIVTFTAPASTNVLVRLTSMADMGAADNVYWGIREATSNLQHGLVLGAAGTKTVSIALLITGISAGSHTYKWSFAAASGTSHILGGPNTGSNSFGPCVMEVWAAP